MNKTSIARFVVSAGLSLVTLAGVMPATPAMADVSYGTGNITINKKDDNSSTVTYDGYQIFKANVTETNGTKSETNVAWANDTVKKNVEELIKETTKGSYAGKTASDAANFIVEHITNTTSDTRVDAASFANQLAKAVDGATAKTTLTPGTSQSLAEGYWLFVTTPTTTDSKQNSVGTAPIFTVVGGTTAVTVTEKTSVPTVDKKIVDGADATSVSDAEAGAEVKYRLTGTVADNVNTYDKYQYKFSDVLGTGLIADTSSVVVKIGDKTVNSGSYTTNYDTKTNTLSVSFADLKGAQDSSGAAITIDGSSSVTVEYTAKLDSTKAVLGGTGNDNTVSLTYSNNPHSTGIGTTTPKSAKLFTYKLTLHKVDRTTEANLSGAKFTVKNSKNKYVQSDGTLGDTAYEFTTDTDGNINVSGLDADTYTVHEITAPSGYDTVADFTFQINPTYDQDKQTLTGLENVLTATDSVIAGDSDGNTSDNVLTGKGANAADATSGTVKITVGDTKRFTMPLTGMDGVTFTWIAGGAVLVIGLANIIRMRKQSSDSE